MKDALRGVIDSVAAARQAIWLEQPAELSSIWTKKGARNQGATTLIRATRRLAELSTTLHRLRAGAKQGGLDLATLKAFTASLLGFYSDYFGGEYYKLEGFSQILRHAKEGVLHVETLGEYLELTSELTLYTSRMDLWVFDVMIPWPELGKTFDEVAARSVAGTGSGR